MNYPDAIVICAYTELCLLHVLLLVVTGDNRKSRKCRNHGSCIFYCLMWFLPNFVCCC